MRTEQCACGGSIRAGSWENSRPFVEAHNRSLGHMSWRWRMGILVPGIVPETPSDDPRRRWPTADDDPRDLSEGTVGASARDVEGAA